MLTTIHEGNSLEFQQELIQKIAKTSKKIKGKCTKCGKKHCLDIRRINTIHANDIWEVQFQVICHYCGEVFPIFSTLKELKHNWKKNHKKHLK